jgi:hypothetical protein
VSIPPRRRKRPTSPRQRDCLKSIDFVRACGRARRRGVLRHGAACSWRSDGAEAAAGSPRAQGRPATGSQMRCRRRDGGQRPGPLEVSGAVPQTALIPVVTSLVSHVLAAGNLRPSAQSYPALMTSASAMTPPPTDSARTPATSRLHGCPAGHRSWRRDSAQRPSLTS